MVSLEAARPPPRPSTASSRPPSGEAIEAALAAFAARWCRPGRSRGPRRRRRARVGPPVAALAVGAPHARHLHVGATSQDVIDTALVLSAGAHVLFISTAAWRPSARHRRRSTARFGNPLAHRRHAHATGGEDFVSATVLRSWGCAARAPPPFAWKRCSPSCWVVQFGGTGRHAAVAGGPGPRRRCAPA